MKKNHDYTEFIDRMRKSIPDTVSVQNTGDRIIASIESGKYSQTVRIAGKNPRLWKFYILGAAAAFLLAFGVHSLMKEQQNSDEYCERQAALATEIPVIDPERKLMNCRQGILFSGTVTDKIQKYNDK